MQPKTKMSSGKATFDLKADRDLCEQCAYDDSVRADVLLPRLVAALDEIEMLRGDLNKCAGYVGIGPNEGQLPIPERVRLCVNRMNGSVGRYEQEIIKRDIRIDEQAKRIADLEASLDLEEGHTNSYIRFLHQSEGKRKKPHAALKKLGQAKRERGKALVEERARVLYFCHAGDLMYDMDTLKESNRLKGKHIGEAREQLRQEGKL